MREAHTVSSALAPWPERHIPSPLAVARPEDTPYSVGAEHIQLGAERADIDGSTP